MHQLGTGAMGAQPSHCPASCVSQGREAPVLCLARPPHVLALPWPSHALETLLLGPREMSLSSKCVY